MEDASMDDVAIRCPICRHTYLGKHIRNPHESIGICDWCSLKRALQDAGRIHEPKAVELN